MLKQNMKHLNKPISTFYYWFIVIVLLWSFHFTPITSQEVDLVYLVCIQVGLPSVVVGFTEDESEFSYIEGSETGPARWGEIKKEWEACNNGELQSPIDLSSKRVRLAPLLLGRLNRHYKPGNATIKNRGHDIAVEWMGDAGSVRINGMNYFLKQSHWHSPSEHTLHGRRYDLELHMVHVSKNNSIVVVALFYRLGRRNHFLSTLTRDILKMIEKREEERNKGIIDPRKITMKGFIYYNYLGSLTVPPCTEGVTWIIHKKISSVSSEQVQILRAAVHDSAEENARPLQPRNQREIAYGFFSRKEKFHH